MRSPQGHPPTCCCPCRPVDRTPNQLKRLSTYLISTQPFFMQLQPAVVYDVSPTAGAAQTPAAAQILVAVLHGRLLSCSTLCMKHGQLQSAVVSDVSPARVLPALQSSLLLLHRRLLHAVKHSACAHAAASAGSRRVLQRCDAFAPVRRLC